MKGEVEKGRFGAYVTVKYIPGNTPELLFYDANGAEVRFRFTRTGPVNWGSTQLAPRFNNAP